MSTIALSCFGAASLEQRVCAHIERIYAHSPELDRPHGVSNEALAEIVRNVLEDVSAGERPLLAGARQMNRFHLQPLMRLKARLDEALLGELPSGVRSTRMLRYRAQ